MTAQYLDLGRVEYGRALEIQRNLALKRAKGEISDTLVMLEHEDVITLGRKTTPANFRPQKVPVFGVERGGDATYHGPGQLVGYPIVMLGDHDVRRHVRDIEKALIGVVSRWRIQGEMVDGHPGVWVQGHKLASIGVAVTNWVAYHGFALNVNTRMEFFELIRPCGLDPSTMTSMQRLLGRPVDIGEVKKAIIEEYSAVRGEDFVAGSAEGILVPDKH
jgi:lipoate-protein ligase B